ncbi:hypothetical protein [Paenibacillus oceani]|uniref:Uncharacterized protein n=1 Tax=Paenibacillus oceani TaxID=2772510 RepID=A0A927CCV2_9BACL|nr:hypothetical protein [Paenibacillus oceani]MBD2865723.1 hypothetical protein [Paenibacillus oceani]
MSEEKKVHANHESVKERAYESGSISRRKLLASIGIAGAAIAAPSILNAGLNQTVSAMGGRIDPGAHVTTVAELASGVFPAGTKLALSDRSMGAFDVSTGGTPNGFDVLDAGNGNTAVLKDKTIAEHFGAVSGSVSDYTNIFAYLQDSGLKIKFKPGGTYKTTQPINLSNGTHFYGENTTILCDHSLIIGTISSDCHIGGFIIDGADKDHAIPFTIATPSSNVSIGDMEWRNFHGVTAFQTYPLYVPMYGVDGFTIGNQKFYNITQDDNGAVTGKGFVGGLYLVGFNAHVPYGKSHGTIGDIHGENIKTVDGGLGAVQDSDLIRGYAETSTTEKFNVTIGNVTARNVAKRVVKAASFGGITVGNVTAFNDDPTLPMHAVVECLGTADGWTFGDIKGVGYGSRICWMKGANNQAGNIFDGFGSQAVFFGGPGETSLNCTVGDILGIGKFPTGSPQGIGVSFYNADGCCCGSITGKFAIAVNTNAQNSGRGSVGAVFNNGRVNLQYGAISISKISADIQSTPPAGAHYILGGGAEIVQADIVTDGRITMSVVGDVVDVDLGKTKIRRASAANGVESSHAVFTTTSATGGILRGNLEIEVNSVVSGTPSGTSGRSLVYLTGLKVEDLDVSVHVTATTRGATGYGIYMNNVDGQANRIAHKGNYGTGGVGMNISGGLTITKAEQLVDGSTLTLGANTAVFLVEKRSTTTLSGGANIPTAIDTTRV